MKKLLIFISVIFALSVRGNSQVGFFMFTAGAGGSVVPAIQGIDSLTSGSVTNAATMDINFGSFITNYQTIIIQVSLLPANDGSTINITCSADGTTFDNGSNNYVWQYNYGTGASTSTGDTKIELMAAVGNAAAKSNNGFIYLQNPNASGKNPCFQSYFLETDFGGNVVPITNTGSRIHAQITQALRLAANTGNLTGSYRVYGIKN